MPCTCVARGALPVLMKERPAFRTCTRVTTRRDATRRRNARHSRVTRGEIGLARGKSRRSDRSWSRGKERYMQPSDLNAGPSYTNWMRLIRDEVHSRSTVFFSLRTREMQMSFDFSKITEGPCFNIIFLQECKYTRKNTAEKSDTRFIFLAIQHELKVIEI